LSNFFISSLFISYPSMLNFFILSCLLPAFAWLACITVHFLQQAVVPSLPNLQYLVESFHLSLALACNHTVQFFHRYLFLQHFQLSRYLPFQNDCPVMCFASTSELGHF